jgi:GT2 family glycosyltransferase
VEIAGIEEALGVEAVVPQWDQVVPVLRSADLGRRREDLLNRRARASAQLESHWRRIRTELTNAAANTRQVEAPNASWGRVLQYRSELHSASLTRAKQDADAKIQQSQEALRKANWDIQHLQAQINQLRNSLSWKVGWPVRYFGRRLPRVAGLVQRGLEYVRSASAKHLPSAVTSEMFDSRWEISDSVVEEITAFGKRQPEKPRKIVIYTAIYGEYDKLLLPEKLDREVDYVCFTDKERNDYGVWELRQAPFYHPDATRIARYVKMHPHELFPEYEIAVWLDGNIVLRGDVHQFIEKVTLEGASLGLISHPHRSCFYDEAEACKRLGKDAPAIIDLQVEHYRRHGLPLNQRLFETGFMIVRLQDTDVASVFRTWWQQLERFSRRDQLGLAWALFNAPGVEVASLLPEGASVRDHEDFQYFRHQFSRALKIPEVLSRLGTVAEPKGGPTFAEIRNERISSVQQVPVDIVVCVHNALEDVRLCLTSVRESLAPGHRVVIVNDRSDLATTGYLREFAEGDRRVTLIENDENLGYTRSANRGLTAATAEFRILLNSDTIVCNDWALKMLDVAMRHENVGIVGPLSNAAGAQSIPAIKSSGTNTAINVLPPGVTPHDLDQACEHWSFGDLFPRVPLVHGFCFGIKKTVIDRIGLFDDQNFQRYFGEENDYCFRAAEAGFDLSIATNTFVFHRKSRSIEEEERIVHMAQAGQRLRDLYGINRIQVACSQVEHHPLLLRIRLKAKEYFNMAASNRKTSPRELQFRALKKA